MAAAWLTNLSRRRRIWPTLVGAAIVVMVARIVSTYPIFNDTADEPYHIGSAVSMLEAHRHIRGTQHPPLTRLVVGVPLRLAGVELPADRNVRQVQWDLTAFETGHEVLLNSRRPYWTVLTIARAAMLVFPIAAVVYVYLLGRYVAGPIVGGLAAVGFSTDPTLLGHGGVVATDVAAAAGYLAGTYHIVRFFARPSWPGALGAGAAVGLALSCKYSCVILLPAMLPVLLTRRQNALFKGPIRAYFRAWPKGSQVLLAAVAAFITLWATFLFDFGRIEPSRRLTQENSWKAIPPWLTRFPVPMPSLVPGFTSVMQHNRAGHFTYFNGTIGSSGSWAYFPEAIAIKTPVAVVLGAVLAVGAGILARRFPRAAGVTLFPAAIYLLVSMNSDINIGIRHVLPVLPLLYIVLVQQLARVRMTALIIAIIVLAFVETLARHPDYLAFFNVLVGGPSNGHEYLLDSNLDWGQDQARLKRWLDTHARGRTVTLRVFGNPRLRQWPHRPDELAPPGSPPRGLLAVSKNQAHGLYLGDYDAAGNLHPVPPLQGLHRMRPIARVGYTIDIYDLEAGAR